MGITLYILLNPAFKTETREALKYVIGIASTSQWCYFLEWVIARFALEFSVFKIIKMPSAVIL